MDLTKHTPGHVSLSVKVKRAIWNVACLCLFRLFPTKLFRLWRILLLKLFGAKVQWDAEVYAHVAMEPGELSRLAGEIFKD